MAMLEGSPSFHCGGTFGHERSTSNVWRLRVCACAAPAIINTLRTAQGKIGFFMEENPTTRGKDRKGESNFEIRVEIQPYFVGTRRFSSSNQLTTTLICVVEDSCG